MRYATPPRCDSAAAATAQQERGAIDGLRQHCYIDVYMRFRCCHLRRHYYYATPLMRVMLALMPTRYDSHTLAMIRCFRHAMFYDADTLPIMPPCCAMKLLLLRHICRCCCWHAPDADMPLLRADTPPHFTAATPIFRRLPPLRYAVLRLFDASRLLLLRCYATPLYYADTKRYLTIYNICCRASADTLRRYAIIAMPYGAAAKRLPLYEGATYCHTPLCLPPC